MESSSTSSPQSLLKGPTGCNIPEVLTAPNCWFFISIPISWLRTWGNRSIVVSVFEYHLFVVPPSLRGVQDIHTGQKNIPHAVQTLTPTGSMSESLKLDRMVRGGSWCKSLILSPIFRWRYSCAGLRWLILVWRCLPYRYSSWFRALFYPPFGDGWMASVPAMIHGSRKWRVFNHTFSGLWTYNLFRWKVGTLRTSLGYIRWRVYRLYEQTRRHSIDFIECEERIFPYAEIWELCLSLK